MKKYDVHAVRNVDVLVVDDEPALVEFTGDTLEDNGYTVHMFTDPAEALEKLHSTRFNLALVDINMPKINGTELSREIFKLSPRTEIIIMTGVPDESNLDPCLKMGLTHFLFKPFNESQLVYTAYAALHFNRLRSALDTSVLGKTEKSGLIGISHSTREIRNEILAIADTHIPVLILGGSGTGKEIIAQDIHANSRRSDRPFIPINCAILGDLAETELFGHVKGAFTGAAQNTSGYIGAADGGTLFFDEVGELPPGVQAKLLRFLDNGEYNKVGDAKLRRANVRIVAATNRDLEEMVRQHKFREDLFYRLNGSVITTIPLDQRKTDILPLIYHFLELFGSHKRISYEISADASAILINSDWPGNVRQLKQTLYKISQIAPRRMIRLADVKNVLGDSGETEITSYQTAKKQTLLEFDREYFIKTLGLAGGSLQKALEISGMHKKNFYAKINALNLKIKQFNEEKK